MLKKSAKRSSWKWICIRLGILALVFTGTLAALDVKCLKMPGKSYSGSQPELDPEQKQLAAQLRSDVSYLADSIGERNYLSPDSLDESVAFLMSSFKGAGLEPRKLEYKVRPAILAQLRGADKKACREVTFVNVIAEVPGTDTPDEIIVIGAHYDTPPVSKCAGADDNASGVAGTLAMARYFAENPQKKTLRFIAFANEEPPFFWTHDMGSYVCAKDSADKKEKIVALLTLECIGYFSDMPKSQNYPPPLDTMYPSKGNFIGFVGGLESSSLVKKCVESFRKHGKIPSEGAALPMALPGIGWSDHWSYSQFDYPAVMVTDTATFRNPYYHTSKDKTHTLDYEKMALVVDGCISVVCDLASGAENRKESKFKLKKRRETSSSRNQSEFVPDSVPLCMSPFELSLANTRMIR